MKILLINPPNLNHIKSPLPDAVEEERGFNPPLGLFYLAGYVQKYSPEKIINILDCQAEKLSYEKIEQKIRNFSPDVIGITVLTFNLIDVFKIIEIAKKVNEKIKTVLGGPHVNIYSKETLGLGNVDYIVLGEGEKIFNDLLNNIDNFDILKKIKGLVFLDSKNNVIHTGLPELISDLDNLPLPARNIVDNNLYSSVLGYSKLVTTMITSRGCPYKCIFCDRPHLGKIFRARSAHNVIMEIEDCLKYDIKEFLMYDDTFTVDRQRVFDICNLIIKQKIKISWDIRARVNTIDGELLEKLKEAGCARVHYGVEAGTQKILNTLRKGITLEQVENVFKLTKKNGLETLAYFMIGNPGETKDDIIKTINFAIKLNPDYVHITATVPYPATELYNLALNKKIIEEDVWMKFAKNPTKEFAPPLWNELLTNNELRIFMKKAYRRFYYRPSYIIKRLLTLKSFEEFKTKAKAGLNILKI